MSEALEVVTAPDPVHHPGRVHELRSAVGSLRVRAGRGGVDRYLFIAACVLVPLGVGLVLLGWYGAAHTPYQFEQLPYVISGGLLGVALTTVGALTLLCHWLTVGIREARAQDEARRQEHKELMAALRRLDGSPTGEEAKTDGRARGTRAQRPVRRAPRGS